MFDTEATRLRQLLLGLGDVSPLLNLGSSTRAFREVTKPHIETELFGPLRDAGVSVFHTDRKAGDGIDLAGDLLDPAMIRQFRDKGFRCVLLSNVLEHVRDRDAVTAVCEEIVGPGGYVVATVPSSCPYHADPIDTYFRPSPQELAALFRRSRLLAGEEVAGRTFADDLRARGATVPGELARTALWALAAVVRPRSFAARAHRWFWYTRPRRVSIAVMQVG